MSGRDMAGIPLREFTGNDQLDGEILRRDAGLATITARKLQAIEFPPIRWIVPGYLVEGLTVFAGKPKIGKSWLALDVALAVAYGGPALGSVQCEPGAVLYAALEDNPRRLQRRIRQLLPDDAAWPERLELMTSMPRLDEGGIAVLEKWIREAENPRLAVLDTLAKVRPIRKAKDVAYDSDYAALAPLQELAGEKGIGVLLVHHVRKMDSDDPLDTVSGTTGLTGAADSVLVLDRDAAGVTLHGRGRDIDEIEAAMQFDKETGRWSVLGDAAEVRRSDERNRIIEALVEHGSAMGPGEIAKAAGLKESSVRHLVRRMVQAGELEKMGRGQYAAL